MSGIASYGACKSYYAYMKAVSAVLHSILAMIVDRLSTRGNGSMILSGNRDVSDLSEFFSNINVLEYALDGYATTQSASLFQARATEEKVGLMSLDFTNLIIRMENLLDNMIKRIV